MNVPRIIMTRTRGCQKGATLVEVLVAIALAGILLPVLATALVTASAGRPASEQQLAATGLMREAADAVRVIGEAGWAGLANGTHHPIVSGTTWALAGGPETVNGFTRQVVISNAQRDGSGNVVESGGTGDPSMKRVDVTVSWTLPYSGSVGTTLYLTRWRNGTSWTQTTQANFNAGTLVNTVTTSTSGGEVQLAAGSGSPSWATPQQSGVYNAAGTSDATDVYVDGATNRAYLVAGTAMYIVNVANPASPALLGTYSVGSAANSVYVSGNYAYLATGSNTAELTVVNVTNPAAPALAGSLNLGGTADATSVFVSGTYAYVGKILSTTGGDNEFYIANITTPTVPTLSGSLNLTANVNSVYVSGNYAYLATAVTTAEMTVVNVTNKAAPASAGVYNAAGTSVGSDVFAVGTTVYLVKANNTAGAEFFILNAATPASVTLVGSYEAGANINGVSVSGTLAFLATAVASRQFTVLNIATPASPTLYGSYNHASTTNDIFVANNTAYLASTSNTAELAIMGQGSAPSGYQTSGTFTTASLNTGANAGFNYLSFTRTAPAGTAIQFQVAANSDNATWNYVGPDGTSSTYFTAAGAIPYTAANGQYFRVRAYLSGNGTVTPVLLDCTVGYVL